MNKLIISFSNIHNVMDNSRVNGQVTLSSFKAFNLAVNSAVGGMVGHLNLLSDRFMWNEPGE